jgi:hypothetical protein
MYLTGCTLVSLFICRMLLSGSNGIRNEHVRVAPCIQIIASAQRDFNSTLCDVFKRVYQSSFTELKINMSPLGII